jgi:hypothetical protein
MDDSKKLVAAFGVSRSASKAATCEPAQCPFRTNASIREGRRGRLLSSWDGREADERNGH